MKNIVLVGFMGSGKTTVGNLISEATDMPLLDMDAMIEAQAGKKISSIFADEGEAQFRSYEREMSQQLATTSGNVISTGGGIVLNAKNITDFEKNGFVICLNAHPDTIQARLQNDTSRPLLEGDKAQAILDLLKQRRPLYEAVPHQIDTDPPKTPAHIAQEIITRYNANNS